MPDPTVVDGNNMTYRSLRKNGWKYSLVGDHAYQVPVYPQKKVQYPSKDPFVSLDSQGLLWFKSGYNWDGASGLTFDTQSSMRGALKHDGLYQLMRAGVLPVSWRERADEVLRDTCIADGMWGWRANMWFRAVRSFAGFAAVKGHDVAEDVLVAP